MTKNRLQSSGTEKSSDTAESIRFISKCYILMKSDAAASSFVQRGHGAAPPGCRDINTSRLQIRSLGRLLKGRGQKYDRQDEE